ncbi:MAG: agmatine deiminase family protein [Ruminococcus sp.]|jgi:agmatine deiminase|nr:agmatine deiminase family protein [Ruminococcus sp.]
MQKLKLKKPTASQLGAAYMEMTNGKASSSNEVFTSDTERSFRAIAEYEDMGAVLFSYIGTESPSDKHKQLPPGGKRQFGVPLELIVRSQQYDNLKNPVRVFIFCDDENEYPNVIKQLKIEAESKNIPFNPDLVYFIPWDTDTYWTRDFSPWWIYDKGTGHYGIAKHIYTTLGGGSVGLVGGAETVTEREGSGIFRCNDDYGAVKLSDWINAPIRRWNTASWASGDTKITNSQIDTVNWFFTGLLNVGGNYMVTSNGVIASSYLVATQNELPEETDPQHPNEEALNARMKYIMEQSNRFLGVNKYLVCTDPTGTYIGHIDCFAKFLSDDKIILGKVDDPKANEGLDKISDFFTENGFTVYRVHAPNVYIQGDFGADGNATTAPYTNSLILNKCVYVPIVGAPYEKQDNAALEVYRKALPDYKVYGILPKKDTPWFGTDALHCRTNAVPREVINNWLKAQGIF